MSKYYTPELEEFHIGFEYEYKTDQEGRKESDCEYHTNTNGEWVSNTMSKEDFIDGGWEGITAFYEICEASSVDYRVKYLDKEDIESLGWDSWEYKFNVENNLHIRYHFGKEFKFPQIVLDPRGNNKFRIFKLKEEGGRMDIIFTGDIKNKSELKKLMKQLGIDD